MSRAEADAALERQIEEGRRLLARPVANEHEYRELDEEHSAWTGFNSELLGRMFTTNHYRLLYGQFISYSQPMRPTTRDREELLKDTFIREQISRLNSVRRRLSLIPEPGEAEPAPAQSVDRQSFDFITDSALAQILADDHVEAQQSFAAGAYKGAAILAAGVVEGMLLDILQRPAIVSKPDYQRATAKLPTLGGSINWNRAGLVALADAAKELGLLHESVERLGRGIADLRDTVHPQNELSNGRRARKEEAAVLLQFVSLLYRDLAALS